MNGRFMPEEPAAAYVNGIAAHVLRVAEILTARERRVGFVLYERDGTATAPELRWDQVFDRLPAAAVRFHDGMDPQMVRAAFQEAFDAVTRDWPGQERPLAYYQTSAILGFAPRELDTMVTHHRPFVADVVESIGPELAARAFEGDLGQAALAQQAGLDVIRADHRIVCAEISPIQVRRLCLEGIDPGRVTTIAPPVACPPTTTALTGALRAALTATGPIAVTAVSRLDEFKNVELFVRGCSAALRDGCLGTALVLGGPAEDPERTRLAALVPESLRDRFFFSPRISHESLAGDLFHRLAGRAVFVCSSRFDLVPYVALEAARTGLCTIVPDLPSVGARDYLPGPFRFSATSSGLAAALARSGPMIAAFPPVAAAIRKSTDDAAFLDGFRQACDRLRSARAMPAPP